jgi:glycerol-3-phosphate dehydrogenase (NAD(P)+)
MTTVCVLGEGAFGTAIAMLLAENGHKVKLWCYYKDVAQSILLRRSNPLFLPDMQLNVLIEPYVSIQEALEGAEYIVEAIPVKYLRSVIMQARQFVHPLQKWIIMSKGIENETSMFPTEILDEVMEAAVLKSVLMGPTFAKEIALRRMSAAAIASSDIDMQFAVKALFDNSYFTLDTTDDVIGVQVAGSLKNVIALAVGMIESVAPSNNTKALFLTRALEEIASCITALGGKVETAYGLAGIGDLMMSTYGTLSRNLEVGRRLGHGESLDSIIQQTGYIPEGINTLNTIPQLTKSKKIHLPLCTTLYEIVYEGKSVNGLINCLRRYTV